MIHDFKKSLQFSENASDEPFWEEVYIKAFPDMVGLMACPAGSKTVWQDRGVDRLLYLKNDSVIRIDEKKRTKEYSDILLEYESIPNNPDDPSFLGWMEKDLAIDYMAYAFMESKRCYLFPWLILRRVWIQHGESWKQKANRRIEGFCLIPGKNKKYVTWSIAIPIPTIMNYLKNAILIEL